MNNEQLKKCPCGKVPKKLYINWDTSLQRWGTIYTDCCASWLVEFKNNHFRDEEKYYQDAVKAWNSLPRGF